MGNEDVSKSENSASANINISDVSGGEITIEGGIFTARDVGGDVVGRDKIVNIHYHGQPPEAKVEEKPPLPFEPETIVVPAGSFIMGSEPGEGVKEYEMPSFKIDLPAYRIGKYPVTNEQYRVYIQKTGQQINPAARWEGNHLPTTMLDHPVMGITWYEALGYCQWLAKETGRDYTLPSEEQWERAVRGVDGRIFPWGNDWLEGYCNHGNIQPTAVTAYPAGVSPAGCFDLVGNIAEWTSTIWGRSRFAPDPHFKYPRKPDFRRDNLEAPAYLFRVYRGGNYADSITDLRGSARQAYDPTKPGPRHKRLGFRVALRV